MSKATIIGILVVLFLGIVGGIFYIVSQQSSQEDQTKTTKTASGLSGLMQSGFNVGSLIGGNKKTKNQTETA